MNRPIICRAMSKSQVNAGTLVVHTLFDLAATHAIVVVLGQRQRKHRLALDVLAFFTYMSAVLLSSRDDYTEILFSMAMGLHLIKPLLVHFTPTYPPTADVVEHAVASVMVMSALFAVYNVSASSTVAETVMMFVAVALKIASVAI